MNDDGESPFSSSEAKSALVDLLNAFQSPNNLSRLEEARAEAGNCMIKQMQIVYPVVSCIQTEVISRYGFSPDGEGIVQFIQHVKSLEKRDREVARLHKLVRAYFIPPINTRQ